MMKYRKLLFVYALLCGLVAFAQPYRGENLSRGMTGIPVENGMYLSWRMLLDDAPDIPFTIYRCTEDGQEKQLNDTPITRTCDFLDQTVDLQKSNRWILKSGDKVLAEWKNKGGDCLPYLRIPISRPANDTVAGVEYSFSANDCSVGDLDGDGNYEIFLKWSPSDSKRRHRYWMLTSWMERCCGGLIWERISVREQPQQTSLSLILMETERLKFVAKLVMEQLMVQEK